MSDADLDTVESLLAESTYDFGPAGTAEVRRMLLAALRTERTRAAKVASDASRRYTCGVRVNMCVALSQVIAKDP